MLGFVCKALFVCACFILDIKAQSSESMEKRYEGILMECLEKFAPSEADLGQLKNMKMPDSEKAKCMIACAYKKMGMMDEKGNLSVEGVKTEIAKRYSDEQDKMQKGYEFLDACKSVNDQPVSDGEKGCERASLIFKCVADKAPEFGL